MLLQKSQRETSCRVIFCLSYRICESTAALCAGLWANHRDSALIYIVVVVVVASAVYDFYTIDIFSQSSKSCITSPNTS